MVNHGEYISQMFLAIMVQNSEPQLRLIMVFDGWLMTQIMINSTVFFYGLLKINAMITHETNTHNDSQSWFWCFSWVVKNNNVQNCLILFNYLWLMLSVSDMGWLKNKHQQYAWCCWTKSRWHPVISGMGDDKVGDVVGAVDTECDVKTSTSAEQTQPKRGCVMTIFGS